MKVSRNAPCPCGSGKKYKKCCLAKDEAARAEKAVIEREPDEDLIIVDEDDSDIGLYLEDEDLSESEEEESEEDVAYENPFQIDLFENDDNLEKQTIAKLAEKADGIDALERAKEIRYIQFAAQRFEGKVALYLKTLKQHYLMDEEMAFEMLDSLYHLAIKKNQRRRFDELIEMLEAQLPEIYEENSAFYMDYRIANALAENDDQKVQALTEHLSSVAADDIDIFSQIMEKLVFYDFRTPLTEAMKRASSSVKSFRDITQREIDEFSATIADYEIFDYIETHPDTASTDPEFTRIVNTISHMIDSTRFIDYLQRILGERKNDWKREDFEKQTGYLKLNMPSKMKPVRYRGKFTPKFGESNLFKLTEEFLYYLYSEESVPYIRGSAAEQHILEYLLELSAGNLAGKLNKSERLVLPEHLKSSMQVRPKHILCPDSRTLNRYLGRFQDLGFPQKYIITMILEQIPAWLRFLETRKLLDHEMLVHEMNEIKNNIVIQILKNWKDDPEDPRLLQRLVKIWGIEPQEQHHE